MPDEKPTLVTMTAGAFARLDRERAALLEVVRAASALVRWYEGEDGVEGLPAFVGPLNRSLANLDRLYDALGRRGNVVLAAGTIDMLGVP